MDEGEDSKDYKGPVAYKKVRCGCGHYSKLRTSSSDRPTVEDSEESLNRILFYSNSRPYKVLLLSSMRFI